MSRRHHVLLIGIDAYDGGGMLTGCVNDIDAVQRLLIERVGVPHEHIRRLAAPRTGTQHETDVPEELPMLNTIRASLERLGTDDVGPEDRVLIYYSGHGTQVVVADGERRFAREALVPKDKKSGAEYRLLFDWEFNTLIARIAARSAAVTVVLDCCNSAGATRAALDEREASARDRFFAISETVIMPVGTELSASSIRGVASTLGSVQHCQVVAACRDDERARESVGNEGISHGELTRALVAQLSTVPAADVHDLRWGRIWRGVEAAVRDANPRQNPWLFGRFGRRVFGFGPDDETDPGFGIEPISDRYRIDAGTISGVTLDAEIGVYGAEPPAFPPLDSEADVAARRGTLRVVSAERASSEAVPLTPFEVPAAPRGRLVRSGKNAALRVALEPSDADLSAQLFRSPLIEEAEPARAELILVRRADGGWALVDEIHGTGETAGTPLLAVIPADRPGLVRAVVEHYYAYVTPLRIAGNCRELPGALRLWLLDCGSATLSAAEAQDPHLPLVQPGSHAPYEIDVGHRVCFVVENTAEVALSVSLFDCAASGRVLLLGERRVPSRARHVFWSGDTLGSPFEAGLAADRSIGVDRIAAIATTRPDLSLHYLARGQSFGDILAPPVMRNDGEERDFGGPEPPSPPVENWTSVLTAVAIARLPGC